MLIRANVRQEFCLVIDCTCRSKDNGNVLCMILLMRENGKVVGKSGKPAAAAVALNGETKTGLFKPDEPEVPITTAKGQQLQQESRSNYEFPGLFL